MRRHLRNLHRRSRARTDKILDRISPTHIPARNPVEFCFALIMALAVFPIAIGSVPLPNSLQESLADNLGQASSVLLVAGCIGVVLGILWPRRELGVVIQLSAMWLVFPGLALYGTALGVAVDWQSQGAYAMGTSYGLAFGFSLRIGQFQLWIRRRKRLADDR